jgi:hypothetical protein
MDDIYDIPITTLFKWWNDGEKEKVIRNLSQRHAAITALMIVQGSHDHRLTVSDCNEISNRLLGDFIRLRDGFGLSATRPPLVGFQASDGTS